MPTVRAFIAVESDEALQREIGAAQECVRQAGGALAIRWVRIDGAHVTLKFLGNLNVAQVPVVLEAMAQAARTVPPFTLSLSGAGGFPASQKARVIWIGLSGDTSRLRELRDAIERHVSPLGFPTEERPFSPHLTLGRVQDNARAVDIERVRGGYVAETHPRQIVKRIVLFKSDLKSGGAVYSPLGEAILSD